VSGAPIVFDRRTVRLRRDRAATRFADHDFLFRRVAEDLAERLGAVRRSFTRVLELGSRSGVFAPHAPKGVELFVQAEISPMSLARARGARVVADEEWLPFAPGSFDLVVSVLSLHAVNDLPGALLQIRRLLRPDGLFLAALFGGETLGELRRAFALAESEVEGGASPRVMPVADLRDLAGLLQRAGFALPVVDADKIDVSYPDPISLMREIRGMGEANALAHRRRDFLKRATLAALIEQYRRAAGTPDARVKASFEIYALTAWAPAT